MFDYYDCVSLFHKLLKHTKQDLYVVKVQAGGWLVQDVQCVSGSLACQFCCKLHSLALSSRQCYCGLTELHIAQSHINQCLQLLSYRRDVFKECICLADRHFQHIVDALAFVFHGESVILVPASPAFRAHHIDRREEIHLYHLDSGSLALLASSAWHVEGEASGLEAADLRVRSRFKKVPYVVEDTCKCGRVASRCASDRALVDLYELVDVLLSH